ncbi:MAG: tRNA 2-thiouridine(34) synthase MnmA [Leptospirillum sp.]
MRPKVLVGMSGGIDSAVAAVILKESGFEVHGAIVEIWQDNSTPDDGKNIGRPWYERSCCHLPMVEYLCEELRLPFITIDRKHAFRVKVVDDFKEGYRKGITPNPCTTCNAEIKLNTLLEWASENGFPFVATGHYVRKQYSVRDKIWGIARAKDHKKDQSYFLSRVQGSSLSRVIFPLGNWTKETVRAFGRQKGLPVEEMVENMEACFLSTKNVTEFLRKEEWGIKSERWTVVDSRGMTLGSVPTGIGLTRGQRRGVGIPNVERMYVKRVDMEKKTVVMGNKREIMSHSFQVRDPMGPMFERTLTAKKYVRFRSTMEGIPCKEKEENRLQFDLMGESDGVTPGQIAVFYDEDEMVIGSGVIEGDWSVEDYVC